MLSYLNKWQITAAIIAVVGVISFFYVPILAFISTIFMFATPLIMLCIYNNGHYDGFKEGKKDFRGHPATAWEMKLDEKYTVIGNFSRSPRGSYLVIIGNYGEPLLLQIFGSDLKKLQPGQIIYWTMNSNYRELIIV